MKRTFKQRLATAYNSAPRIAFLSPELAEAQRLDQIKAKAAAHIANNPQPRAMYLLG